MKAAMRHRGAFLRGSVGDKIFDLLLIAFMIAVLIATLFPFLNAVALAFNDSKDSIKGGIGIWPRRFTLQNFQTLARYPALRQGMLISVARTVLGATVSVLSTSMLAYAISRRDFILRRFTTLLFLLTMYIDCGLIPHFMVIRLFKLNNSFWVYIIPGLISAYNLIVMRSFIDQLPYSLQESAFLDGANDFVIFWRVVMPLSGPVIATVALFCAVGQWNSWFDTFLYAPFNESITTMQYELMKVLQSASAQTNAAHMGQAGRAATAGNVSPLSVRMTITVVSILPIICVYPFVQRYFVTGITLGAVKS
ncbi:carbohydrate ABC transporter permease [Bacillota bacterium Meth-B3]|nr:carbohydrate ABC transporter permease [Christensenellaceae bacterium]MEA5067866.1 carbohydrate ABC transporter permease [Christensenellaceae bacterium]